jgi:hypothetical protein
VATIIISQIYLTYATLIRVEKKVQIVENNFPMEIISMLKVLIGLLAALLLGYFLMHFLENFQGIMVGKEDSRTFAATKPEATQNAPTVTY